MANNQFIARRVNVGIAIETTPGTPVAATNWIRQLNFGGQRKTTVIKNDSAMGRIEKTNDSAKVAEWFEGPLSGKVSDITIGYLLYAIFGSVSTAANADASGTVKDHTFNTNQTNVPPSLTITRKDPISERQHSLGTLDSLEITWETGEWVKFKATLKAKAGTTSSTTATYLDEAEFTSKHVTAKLASLVGGLSGATALESKSGRITITRPVTPFIPNGAIAPSVFTGGVWDFDGELVLQYNDATLETTWYNNTAQALSIAFINSDVTIGTAARPGLTFTAPRVRLNTFEMGDDLDEVVEQTVGFTGEIDLTSAYALRALLTNTKASY